MKFPKDFDTGNILENAALMAVIALVLAAVVVFIFLSVILLD
jgi:hypothetical protein